jgi:hypothetical protein
MPVITNSNRVIISGGIYPFVVSYNLQITAQNSSYVILSWNDYFQNEDGFKIEYSTDSINYSVINTTAASVTSYVHNISVTGNTTTYYRIRAYKGTSYADYSNVVSAVYNFTDWYGIQWDITASSPLVTRIASNMTLHSTLPVQSGMRACVLKETGVVNYYLNPLDWTQNATGGTSKLDGTDGHVMIEIPAYYILFNQTGNTQSVKISSGNNTGWTLVPKCYIGAYEASLNRSTNKLASIINTTTTYRGGNNTSSWDGTYRTLLGKPATNISRTNFRTYARNIGTTQWNILPYHVYKSMFWLYMIEYANRNCQSAVTGNTVQGYHQGGLGLGVTTVDTNVWNSYNSYNPVVPCGSSNSLGNFSGEVSYGIPAMPASGSTTYVKVPRYRGIENLFGHIWKWQDGAVFDVNASTSSFYFTSNPNYFDDSTANKTNQGNIARASDYVKTLLFGTNGDILPIVGGTAGASAITYWCDYYYSNTSTALYALFVGGSAYDGSFAGLGYCSSHYAASDVSTALGSRLCFLP